MPLLRGMWRYARTSQRSDPLQGWKLHVSATLLSAPEVFARALPSLRRRNAQFKVPRDPLFLAKLNCGIPDFSQVGKFLTVYPQSDAEAVILARELHQATRGLPGPDVPYDRRYTRNSLVHYRYGLFAEPVAGVTLHDASGKAVRDERGFGKAVPGWASNPFPTHRVRLKPGPIGDEILVEKAHTQRGKGGVYEAIDRSMSPAETVILKEGRRHGETDWNGIDGFELVRREARALRALHKAGVPVPRVLREFTQSGKRYLVLEKVPGRPLQRDGIEQPSRTSWQNAARWLDRLGPSLAQIHAAGWVWRDCKPKHIFVHRGNVRFVDFEGACRTHESDILPWGSLDYMPPDSRRTFAPRKAGVREDLYALGVIAFQFLAGQFPERSAGARATVYKRTECPLGLRTRIENLLRAQC